MTLLGLSGLLLLSLVGPALSSIPRVRVPMVVGELAAGAVIGTSGLRWAHPSDRVFTFLAQAGFALVMMVAGSHVPVRDPRLRRALARGLLIAVGIAALAVPVAYGLSHLAGTGPHRRVRGHPRVQLGRAGDARRRGGPARGRRRAGAAGAGGRR